MVWGVLCLAALAVAASTVQSFECPTLRTQALIPDPDDCRKYYHCLPDGRVFPMQCPNDLVFDPRQKVCIWDSNARSCAPDYALEPVKQWQPKGSTTNKKAKTSDTTKGNNSRGKKTHRQKKTPTPSRNRNQNNKRKPVSPQKSRNAWTRRTTRRRFVPTTTTTQKPTTTTPTPTTTRQETTEAVRDTTDVHANTEKMASADVEFIDNILATLGFDIDAVNENGQPKSSTEYADSVHVTDQYDPTPSGEGKTNQRKGDNNSQHSQSQSLQHGRQSHSLQKRSPEDNLIWDNIRCPSGYAYISDPSDCRTFYHCYNWQPMKKLCPPGLFFDEQTYVCNWPHNVNCIEGYRTKSLFAFNDMKITRDKIAKRKISSKTTSAPKKSTKKIRRKFLTQRRTTATTTATTETTAKPTTKTTTTQTTTTRVPTSTPVFSPSPQGYRNNVIDFKYSNSPLDSIAVSDTVNEQFSSTDSTDLSTSDPPTSLPSSSSTPTTTSNIPTLPARKSHSTLHSHDVFSSEKQSSDKETIFNGNKQFTATSKQRLSSLKPTSQAVKTTTLRHHPTGPLYDFKPSQKMVDRIQAQFSGFSFNKPSHRSTDRPNTIRWRTADTISWEVTSNLPHSYKHDVQPQPYASDVKRVNNGDQRKEGTTSADTPVKTQSTKKDVIVTASPTRTKSITETTKTVSDFISTTSTGIVETSTHKATMPHNQSNTTAARSTTAPSGIHKLENSSSTPASEALIDHTSTTGNKTAASSSTPLPTDSTTTALKSSTPAATKPRRTTTAPSSTTKKATTTPIAFTAAKIPFFAMKNQRMQPVSWMNKERLPLTSTAFRRGSRLRARTQNSQGRSMNASPFLRPSMAASFANPANQHFRSPADSARPDKLDDVRIEKFMIKLLNDAMRSKHVVSRDIGDDHNRSHRDGAAKVTITYEQTTDRLKERTATDDIDLEKPEVSEPEKNTPATLFLEVNTKPDFSTVKNVEDMRVSGQVITDMAASISTPADSSNTDNIFKREELIIKTPASLTFSAIKPADDNSENLIMVEMETDEVFDKRLLEKQDKVKDKKGSNGDQQTSQDSLKDEELNYSGDVDGDWHVPKIQPFSALAGDDHSKEKDSQTDSDSVSTSNPSKDSKTLKNKEVKMAAASDQVSTKEQSKENRTHSQKASEKQSQNTTTTTQSSTTKVSQNDAGELSTHNTTVHSNATENTETTTSPSTTTLIQTETPTCNTSNCASNQTQGVEKTVLLNSTQTTLNTTTTNPETTTTMANAEVDTSTQKAEPYVAKDALLVKDTEEDDDNNRIDVETDTNKDKKLPKDDSDFLNKDEMRKELDGVEPKGKKETSNEGEDKILMTPANKVSKESDVTPSAETSHTSPSSSKKEHGTVEVTPVSLFNSTKEESSTILDDFNSAKDALSRAKPTETDISSSQNVENTSLITTEVITPSVTNVTDASTSFNRTNTQTETQNFTAAHTTESNINATVVSDNVESSNSTVVTVKNETSSAAAKSIARKDKEPGNTTLSTLVVSVEPEDTVVFGKDKSSKLSTTAAPELDTNTTKTQETNNETTATSETTTKASTVLPSVNLSHTAVSLENVTVVTQSNNTKTNLTEASEQIPVAYLSNNANVKTENMIEDPESEFQDGKQMSETPESNFKETVNSSNINNISTDSFGKSVDAVENVTQPAVGDVTQPAENDATVTANADDVSATVAPSSTNSTTAEPTTASSATITAASPSISLNISVDQGEKADISEQPERSEADLETTPKAATSQDQAERLQEEEVSEFSDEALSSGLMDDALSVKMKKMGDQTLDVKATSPSSNAEHDQQSKLTNPANTVQSDSADVTTNESTSSKRSFVSLTDLITWYLKHWRNYSKWRQDQTTPPTTFTF